MRTFFYILIFFQFSKNNYFTKFEKVAKQKGHFNIYVIVEFTVAHQSASNTWLFPGIRWIQGRKGKKLFINKMDSAEHWKTEILPDKLMIIIDTSYFNPLGLPSLVRSQPL